tara:strand:+ start:368 stop:865 length:498 start_codon:yes stop_codon:yes gene_type:complete
MHYIKVTIFIFFLLAVSRILPHPPNFTSLLALSFYVPLIFGKKFIPAVILSFAITDYIIGYHSLTHWTWGSVVIIGLISQYFKNSIYKRVGGALSGALIFFIITNFGVWVNGSYGYSFNGLLSCYTLAIPFFTYSLISTFIFSGIIEALIKIKFFKSNQKYFEKI